MQSIVSSLNIGAVQLVLEHVSSVVVYDTYPMQMAL